MTAAFMDGFWFSMELLATGAGLCVPLIAVIAFVVWVTAPRGRRLTDRA